MDSRKPLQNSEIYQFGGFRVDAERLSARHGEDNVPLTPKECRVLLLLIERAGKVVRKDELLNSVWPDVFVEEATLARNISWLRKKLADYEGGENLIETVPKRGYRFTAEVIRNDLSGNLLIVEEETVRQFELEENISLTSSELLEAYRGVSGIKSPTATAVVAASRAGKSSKLAYFVIGTIALLGIGLLLFNVYFKGPGNNQRFAGALSPPFSTVNLALGKSTRQSSDAEKNRGLSHEAVDGNTNGNWFEASVSSTGNERNDEVIVFGTTDPWWEVDLGTVREIEQVKIYLKTDLRSQFIDNFRVDVKDGPGDNYRPFVEGTLKYDDFRASPIVLTNNAKARFVRIQMVGASRTLYLAEVEVLGPPLPGENYEIPQNCVPNEVQISLFPEPQFRGECRILSRRNYENPESMGGGAGEFYSLLVGTDIKAVVCDDVDFNGNCEEIATRRSFETPIRSVKTADYFKLKDKSGNCLEVGPEYAAGASSVSMKPCDDNANQNWFWSEWGELRVSARKCLDLTEADQIVATACDKRRKLRERAQRWVWTLNDEIRTATRNKTCLTVTPEGTVMIEGCVFKEDQIWSFAKLP